MKQVRDSVYIWVTWLTKLISGEQQCEWQSWFKAHHKYDKKPGSFDLAKWSMKHNKLMHACRDKLKAEGYTVTIEDQNQFYLNLPSGITVSGKADVAAIKGRLNLIVDCKTGQPKNSDLVQVMLYMIFLPLCIKRFKDIVFEGQVSYSNYDVPIHSMDIDNDLKDLVYEIIEKIGGETPLPKCPSYGECRYCDITKKDCSEKVEKA